MVEQNLVRRRKPARSVATSLLTVRAARLPRPMQGIQWEPDSPIDGLPCEGKPAWIGNGGAHRGHPARSLPFSFDVNIPENEGELRRITFVGIFALYATKEDEAPGAVGATIQLLAGGEMAYRQDFIHGRHYRDATDLSHVPTSRGDGTKLTTLGFCEVDGELCRVDSLSIDVPQGAIAETLRFKDLGTAASFVFFDVFFEFEPVQGCPFKAASGGVALGDLAAIVRVGDRVRFTRALDQLVEALSAGDDLDEARGQALTFLAVVTAGTLEMGGSREMHRVQLEAARRLDKMTSLDAILEATREIIEGVAAPLFGPKAGPSARLVDRALNLVERNYAKNLSDASVAEQLGLSTSHFRYLFKQATGQPFHKYLVAVRLEKARRLLMDDTLPVSTVASAVGFSGLAHFSRAFSHRFQVSPTSIRRSVVEGE